MRSCFCPAGLMAVALVCAFSVVADAQSGTRQAIGAALPNLSQGSLISPQVGSIPTQQVFPGNSFAPVNSSAFSSPGFASGGFAPATSTGYGPARIVDVAGPPSVCDQLGPLCVPPLLGRPLSCDRPQIGRQYCRPLFGRWPGY